MLAFGGSHDQLLERLVDIIEDDEPEQIVFFSAKGETVVTAVSVTPGTEQVWAETLREMAAQIEAGVVTMAKT